MYTVLYLNWEGQRRRQIVIVAKNISQTNKDRFSGKRYGITAERRSACLHCAVDQNYRKMYQLHVQCTVHVVRISQLIKYNT